MLAVYVSVPVACFRKGMAREYLETERLPPPSTCYGFLLSLVGESDRTRHFGVKVCPVLLFNEFGREPPISVVLRTVWRVKKTPLGTPGNTRPDYQQLLTGVELLIWVDSSEEPKGELSLEDRVRTAMDPASRGDVSRFGGLSLGESTHLVDQVKLIPEGWDNGRRGLAYLLKEQGRLTLPVWVDHVGSAGTCWVTGDLVPTDTSSPPANLMPRIKPQSPL